MNIFALSDFINIILAILLCALIYLRDPSSKLSKYFLLITIISSYSAFCEFFRLISQNMDEAIFWHKTSFLWPLLSFLFFRFILIQTESKLFTYKILNVIILIPGILISLLHLFTNVLYTEIEHRWFGWEFNDSTNIYSVLVAAYFLITGILSLVITILNYLKQENPEKRKQILYTIIGLSIPIIDGMVTKGILPQFGINTPPTMSIFFLIGTIFLAISILKYKAFLVNPFELLQNMFATSPDYLVIYNNNGEIVMVSNSFIRNTAFVEKEVIGRKLDIFFKNGSYPEDMELAGRIGKELELEILTKDGSNIPVSATTSILKNYTNDEYFFLLLGRDLSERKRFEKQLIQFKMDLEEKVKVRTAELAKSNIDLHIEIQERKNVENALRISEKRYRDLFENSPIGIFRTTTDGKILMANPAIMKMLGYNSFLELKEKNLENERSNIANYFSEEMKKHLADNSNTAGFESIWIRKDGSEIFVRVNANCIYDDSGKEIYYEGTIEDITEQIKAVKALKESEEKFRNLSEQSPNMIFIYQYGRLVYVNKKCTDVLGYSEDYFTSPSFNWKDILAPLSLEKANEIESNVRNREQVLYNEYTFVKKDGGYIEVLISISEINYMGGIASLGILTDITYRIEYEKAIKESEERFRNLIENINEIYYIADHEGRTVYASPNIFNFTGYPVKEWINEKVLKFVYKGDLKRVLRFYIENRDKGIIDASIEFRSVKKDGTIFWVEQITRFVRHENGSIKEFRSVTRDITKRKEAEEKLQLLAQAVRSSGEGISITDLYNNILFINDAFIKMYGYTESELLGRNISLVRSEDNPNPLIEEIRISTINGSWYGELVNRKKDGTEFPIYLSTSNVVNDKNEPYALVGIVRDISERKKFEKALRESEKRYRNLFNNSPLGIYRTTPDGKILLANPAIIKMLGYSSLQELINRDLEKEGYDESINNRSNFKYDIEKYGEVKGTEVRWVKKDGTKITLRESAKCVRDEKGNVLYYDGTVEDITEQINAIHALRESEEKFRTLSEKSPNIIVIVKKGKIIYINEKCVEIMGYEKEYFISSSFEWKNVLDEESYKKATERYGEGLKNYTPEPGEFTVINKEGERIDIIISTTPINYLGEMVTLAILTNITERRNAERQLENYRNHLENLVDERTRKLDNVNKLLKDEIEKLKIAEENIQDQLEFMSTLIDTIPNPVFIKDSRKRYTGCNKAFGKFYNRSKNDIIGKTIYDIAVPEIAKIVDEKDDKLLRNPGEQYYEMLNISDRNSAPKDILVYKGTFNKADGTLGGMVGVMLDITEIKKLQKEILKALDKEKELNELKSRFISVASHEFRTPLTSILAAADLLELYGRKWPNEKYYEYLRNIQNAVVYMNELINDVLTVNKSESDKIKFNPTKVDLHEILTGILENAKLSAPDNIQFIFEYELNEKIFNLDSKLITQILTNLLSNSAKYSPKGGKITLKVTKEEKYLSFLVADEGIGIPGEDQKLLFEPFHRGQNVGAISGTGLGLSIVKKSTEIHHGMLYINSILNKGTEVEIKLPYT